MLRGPNLAQEQQKGAQNPSPALPSRVSPARHTCTFWYVKKLCGEIVTSAQGVCVHRGGALTEDKSCEAFVMSLNVKAMGAESSEVAPSSSSPCRVDEESRVRNSCPPQPLNGGIGFENMLRSDAAAAAAE